MVSQMHCRSLVGKLKGKGDLKDLGECDRKKNIKMDLRSKVW